MADRPTLKEEEIVITPEMIEAGMECYWKLPELLGPDEDELRWLAANLYRRMEEARRLSNA